MVTLCPSEVPDAQGALRARSERPRDVEDKIAGDGLAERFSLLADTPILAQNDRQHEARSGPVLARIGGLVRDKPRLVYAAYTRCPCGAGLAYEPDGESGKPIQGYWDCSAILRGEAIPTGEPGAVQHTGQLPFAFYDIKGENQPSAEGATTRPAKGEVSS